MYITFNIVFNEVPEPKDYHRFTKGYIEEKLLKNFSEYTIIPLGNRVTSSLYIIEPLLKFKIFKILYLILLYPFYFISKKISKKFVDQHITYYVEATK